MTIMKLNNGAVYNVEDKTKLFHYYSENESPMIYIHVNSFTDIDIIDNDFTVDNMDRIEFRDDTFEHVLPQSILATKVDGILEVVIMIDQSNMPNKTDEILNRLASLESSQSDQDDALVELADIIAG